MRKKLWPVRRYPVFDIAGAGMAGGGGDRERERINDAVICDDCVAWGVYE